ncbi:hypothetical protein L0152_29805, partial [bacterium]|nr:hypothetical protein [bacterium]
MKIPAEKNKQNNKKSLDGAPQISGWKPALHAGWRPAPYYNGKMRVHILILISLLFFTSCTKVEDPKSVP